MSDNKVLKMKILFEKCQSKIHTYLMFRSSVDNSEWFCGWLVLFVCQNSWIVAAPANDPLISFTATFLHIFQTQSRHVAQNIPPIQNMFRYRRFSLKLSNGVA